jgi:hypothetical protein
VNLVWHWTKNVFDGKCAQKCLGENIPKIAHYWALLGNKNCLEYTFVKLHIWQKVYQNEPLFTKSSDSLFPNGSQSGHTDYTNDSVCKFTFENHSQSAICR